MLHNGPRTADFTRGQSRTTLRCAFDQVAFNYEVTRRSRLWLD